MGRAPCCDKIGLKKGPWTPEEDRILVDYIQSHGHENWRALPKQAGLLRCGKSCRLRWINYLRPDIKRGNFSREEEEMIIQFHEMLGNRWSAIAARLPGRTDNEIKNVWHTHLKKRLKPKPDATEAMAMVVQTSPTSIDQQQQQNGRNSSSPTRSCSAVSTSSATTTTNSSVRTESSGDVCMDSLHGFPEIDESFWSEALSMDENSVAPSSGAGDLCHSFGWSESEGDLSFWLRVFMETGDVEELPAIEMF